MAYRVCLLWALPSIASAGFFGPPKFVKEACEKWCKEAAASSEAADAIEACKACHNGPQHNPECTEGTDCDYCKKEIVFPRHYPKLWKEDPDFEGKMGKLEGKTRCWCDTGCPVYSVKSWLFCRDECAAVCQQVPKGEVDVEVV
eukprot:TRINITY_DN44659_c0_g1_i1.p1 TRINITY_DN44659_c0_g1~~TRINITY_DN44659_c0_g1_i1.p1  ORF type:complete len:158 (+),score=46.49 TRINITY_DN44659_c0_g1_i1:45-476(+)